MTKKMTDKEINTKAKEALEILEQEVSKPYTIESRFYMQKPTPIALRDDSDGMRWIMKLMIGVILDRSFYRYDIKLSINEKPFEDRINDLETKKFQLNIETTLPGMSNKAEEKALQDKIDAVRTEMENLIRQTDTIKFITKVASINYKGDKTLVEFIIPSDVIELLNKNRFYFNQYKISLEPMFEQAEKDGR